MYNSQTIFQSERASGTYASFFGFNALAFTINAEDILTYIISTLVEGGADRTHAF